MIKPIIHFLWFGGNLPEKYQENIESFRFWNPGYEIKIHEGAVINKAFRRAWELCECPAQKSDILRLNILRHHGGWYFDCDCRCFNSLDKIVLKTEKLAMPDVGGFVDNWMIGCHEGYNWQPILDYFNEWPHKMSGYATFGAWALSDKEVEPVSYMIVSSGSNTKLEPRDERFVIGHNWK